METGRELVRFAGPSGRAVAVMISADRRRLVNGGGAGLVRCWDLAGGREVACLSGHLGGVDAVSVSADGRRAVSCGTDATVRVWNLPP